MFIALLLLDACAPEERNVYRSLHIAPNGAKRLGGLWAINILLLRAETGELNMLLPFFIGRYKRFSSS